MFQSKFISFYIVAVLALALGACTSQKSHPDTVAASDAQANRTVASLAPEGRPLCFCSKFEVQNGLIGQIIDNNFNAYVSAEWGMTLGNSPTDRQERYSTAWTAPGRVKVGFTTRQLAQLEAFARAHNDGICVRGPTTSMPGSENRITEILGVYAPGSRCRGTPASVLRFEYRARRAIAAPASNSPRFDCNTTEAEIAANTYEQQPLRGKVICVNRAGQYYPLN